MFTNGFGEIITTYLTLNPKLRSIPSASSILDVSNFTFNAVTLGKDSDGFNYHAHTVYSSVLGVYNDGFVIIKRYNTLSPSSYHVSATHAHFSATYSSVPCDPRITDTRLERKSTTTPLGGSDTGHYLNAAIDPALSSVWHMVGAYPPSGEVGKYKILDSSGGFVYSGLLSGSFNSNKIVDKYGFIKISELSASDTGFTPFASGPKIYADSPSSFATNQNFQLIVVPQVGDAAALEAFGGVNHIGVYCLDIKAMLDAGLNPPYSWNYLNNTRKYKLVAKVTFWKDLLKQDDYIVIPSVLEFPGFRSFLVQGLNAVGTLGPAFALSIRFIS